MKYSFDHWNKVLELPDGEDRQGQLRLIGGMARGNLHYFVRRLLGKKDDPAYPRNKHEFAKRSDFILYMERIDEDTFR
jgi:hypothetical protein